MNLKTAAGSLAVAASLGSASAFGATIDLTFVGLENLEPILDYYDGGLGGSGSGPGPNYGITFGADSLAIISAADGGTGNFNGAPHDTIAFFLSGSGDVMDKASGFTTGFSFFYSSPFYTGTVTVWSGLDGTGTELASITLPATPSGGAGCVYTYCPWFPKGVKFSGTAESVVFSGVANYIGFGDVTLGSADPSTPEPSTWAMMLLGFAGLAFAGYRTSRNRLALLG
ncbi:MAG: PEP-CTERM sorting domain-containing protein [Hyphomicrobiales bacterium]|nr:PEP-CTERM sorting domain-containing protein [Hyphomicrobiales bacterium]